TLESMNRWASVRHSHQPNMSTVFIESIESALSTTRPYATEPSFPRKWESRTRGLGNRFIR
ncbi:hypothetical protein ACJ4OD_002191, partial [Neisseria gonorrhoeae]